MTTLAFEPVDLKVAAATQPYFVFSRLSLAAPRVYDLYTVPFGFNYLLRRVISRWDGIVVGSLESYTLPVEIFNAAQQRARQNAPVPLPLVSTPGGDTTVAVEPSAPLGVSFVVLPRHSAKIINIGFPYGDTVKLEVSTPFPAPVPTAIDIVLEGYLVPEQALGMWGKEKRKGGGNAANN